MVLYYTQGSWAGIEICTYAWMGAMSATLGIMVSSAAGIDAAAAPDESQAS